MERKNHPWFIGVQFHPELKSTPFKPHPIFNSFIKALIISKNDEKIKITNDFFFSNELDLKFILGPCQIESKSHAFDICSEIDKLSKKLDFRYVYKSSFDKANRSSHNSKRGVGFKKGLEILSLVKEKFGCPVTSDIHEVSQCNAAKNIYRYNCKYLHFFVQTN